jgi:phenylpropionate dioxygenase-like ring-hydroxylating dioxygenase large terminal subunit
MSWSRNDLANLVEPDRVHRKAYVDPEIFELEMERIFEKAWIYAGHESQVPNPGDYYTFQLGRQPMIMMRGKDGQVRVFFNRCPHRGALLCSARKGNAGSRLRCSYHAWLFSLDGKVESIPGLHDYDGTRFDRDVHGLKPAARAASYRGFWFASLSKDGPDLETYLSGAQIGLDQIVDRAPAGDVEVVGDCFRMIQKSNWKIFLENQLDVSHPCATHESTGQAAWMVEREIEKTTGEKPPLSYHMLSMFKTPIEELGRAMETRGHPYGHTMLQGYMALRPKDPDTLEYERRLAEAYGEKRKEEIMSIDLHHVLVYPCLSVQPLLQQLRAVRPLSADRTLTEIWHFRLKGANEAIYRRALDYYYLVNSPSTMVNADDLHNFWKCHLGLSSDGGDWVSLHRNAGQDMVDKDTVISAPKTMSELPLRHMMQTWKTYMTAEA